MKEKITLSEELGRIKSLFSEERLYGNIIESKLLTEQGIGKRLADALETASSSVAKAIKNIDPKLATNFLNSEINTFDDLAKHLNDYKSLWRSMGIDWDYANDVVINLNRWNQTGYLKNVSDKDMLAIINDLPVEGDLKGMVFDLWKESKGKYIPPKTKSKTTIVTKSNTGENVVHKVETVGGKEKIETYTIEGDGIKKDDSYDTNRSSEEVNAYFEGRDIPTSTIDSGDVKGNSISSDEPINPNGNPDVIQGQMIELLEKVKDLLDKKGDLPKPITPKGLEEGISNGGNLIVKGNDGKLYKVEKVDNTIVTIDENGIIIDVKELGTIDTTPKPDPIETGTKNYGDKNIPSSTNKNIDKSLLGVLRYVFPVLSSGVRGVRYMGDKLSLLSKGYTKNRYTRFPKSTDAGTSNFNVGARLGENLVRAGGEQLFLIYFYGSYKLYQRGEENPFGLDTLFSKKLATYTFFLKVTVWEGFTKKINDMLKYFSSKEGISEYCKNDCEFNKKVSPSEVTKSPCYIECVTKTEKAAQELTDLKNSIESYANTLKEIGDLENMDASETEKFCSGADGKKLKFTNSLTKMKTSIIKFEKYLEKLKQDNQILGYFIDFFGLPKDAKNDDVLDKVLTPPGEKERISVSQLEELQKQIDERCIDWYNREESGEIPINNDGPVNDTPNIEDDGKSTEEKGDMVYLNISIIPIELTGEES
jgi:hypothetical protein